MEWPKKDEKLFRWDTDCHFNACINAYYLSLSDMAIRYREGADVLAVRTAEGDVILDRVIIPIVFLYRQYLELLLKDLIDTARRVEGEGEGYPKHHNLGKLWDEAKRLIKNHYKDDVPKELDYVQPCIDEFNDHDPESFSFRYPTDKKGAPTLREISHINLRNLYETMGRLGDFLDCISGDLGQKLDSLYEN